MIVTSTSDLLEWYRWFVAQHQSLTWFWSREE